jgi:hypothetical protein
MDPMRGGNRSGRAAPRQVGKCQVLDQRHARGGHDLADGAPARPGENGTRRAVQRRLHVHEHGVGGHRGAQCIGPHAPAVDVDGYQRRTQLGERGDDPRVGGGFHGHGVAGPDPARGRHADGLLPAGRHHDLIGLGGQPPAGDVGREGIAQ